MSIKALKPGMVAGDPDIVARFVHTLLLLVAAVLLAGCSPATTAVPSAPTHTLIPTATRTWAGTRTWTATPTDVPAPQPTHTATPRVTPSPTATSTSTPTPLPPVTAGQEEALTQGARGALPRLVDLPGYEIEAMVDLETLTVTGRQRVIYTNRHAMPLAEVYFNLYANAPRFGGEMTVINVAVNGQPIKAAYEKQRRALRVPLPTPLPPGERMSIEMGFSLRVPHLAENRFQVLVYSKDILSLAGWYPLLAVLDEAGWHLDYPRALIGEAIFCESAFYTVQLTVPQNLVVAATGVQVGETTHDDGMRTLTYRSGPSRTFYLSASPAYQVVSGQAGEVAVHSYHLPDHEACGQWVLEAAIAALELYGELYGPYPYLEFDAVEADQWYQGVEWPGMILLGSAFYDGSDPACGEWFVAHETAHQWWYNVVGNDPVAHPWLDEALAQYSTMLYYRRLWPPDGAQAYIGAIIYDRFALYADRSEGIHVGQAVTAFEDREAYYAIVYARGAMFFQAVHNALGEEPFFAALRRYYERNAFGIATPEKLRATLRLADPEGIDKLWAEWVVGP